jgi:hypothetical protein
MPKTIEIASPGRLGPLYWVRYDESGVDLGALLPTLDLAELATPRECESAFRDRAIKWITNPSRSKAAVHGAGRSRQRD